MSRLGRIGHQLYAGEVSYDFIGHRRRWYLISGILITIAILATLIRGLNFGIEFRGGADFQVPAKITSSSVQQMETALAGTGISELGAEVTTIGGNTIRVETRTLDATTEVPKVRSAIAAQAGTNSDNVAYSLIGASWGGQITDRALIALAVFLVLVGLIIWIYFRNGKMALAALVALLHDLILTVGIYALVGFPVTPATVIGVLTILGYSLYDTVVVFDKVRENVRDIRSSTTKTYSEAANLAVNQVLVRSINTTVIGVLPVAALLIAGTIVLGGSGPLQDLALALFVGMISGAYSSIFIATPLLAQLKEREPDMVKQRQRVENRRAREAGEPVPHAVGSGNRARKRASAVAAGPAGDDPTEAEKRAAAEKIGAGVAGREDAETVGAGSGTRTIRLSMGGSSSSGPGSSGTGSSGGGSGANDPRTQRLSDGAAKRPQPEKKPRSQRHT